MLVSRLGGLQLVAASFCLAVSLAGNACATIWDGGGSDINWNTADNWDTDSVPTSSDQVLIQGGSTNASIVAPAEAYNIRVGDDAVLDISSTLTLSDRLFWGTNPTPGTINVNAGGTINLTSFAGYVDANAGTLNVNSGGSVIVQGLNPTTPDSVYLSYGDDQTSAISINGGTFDATGTLHIGSGGKGTLELHGGTLTSQFGEIFLGTGGGGFADGTLIITDGTATLAGNLLVGHLGDGLFEMSGGSLTTPGGFLVGFYPSATGTANLLDGTVDAGSFGIGTGGGTGLVNIENGTLIIDGDQTAAIDNFVTSGQLVAFGGTGTISRTYDGSDTIVTAIAGSSLSGDFDFDDDVDGDDFLLWQRGGSPNSHSQSDLADWESNYGTELLVASTSSVPEPSSLMLGIGVLLLTMSKRLRSGSTTPA